MDWNWDFVSGFLPRLLDAFALTVVITGVASAIALVLGLAFALARRSSRRALAWPVTAGVELVRRTPLLLQLYFVFYALPQFGLTLSAILAGVVGLGIHHAAYTGETYRAGIDAVPRGQWDAATALDLSSWSTWTRVILPQSLPGTLAAQGNWVILMFKQSALLAAITVQELLNVAQQIGTENFDYVEPLTVAALLYFAVSYPASIVVRHLERRFAWG